MRVSTIQYFTNGVSNIQSARDALGTTQQKIATGKKILAPSDDPIRSTQVLKVKEELSLNEQYKDNISFATNKNQLVDSVLHSVVDALQRIRDLTLRANNAVLSDNDRRGIGIEVEALQEQMVSLLNTKDGTGEYVFAGYQGATIPFIEQPGGGYSYQGDEGFRVVEIAAGDTIEISDSGKKVFVDVPSANNTILTSAAESNSSDSTARISTGLILDQEAFDAVYPEDFAIVFNDPALNQNQRTLTITQRSDGSPVFGTRPGGHMINVPYEDGGLMEFNGIEFFVTGDPQPGDTFFIESSANESTLDTVERLASILKAENADDIQLPTQVEVIGRATPGRPTTTLAGNYVAAQQITVETETTIEQTDIPANATAPEIAALMNALAGVTAAVNPTVATLDISQTSTNPGDLIQFELNGMAISAVVGTTNTATWANVENAITTAIANDAIAGGPGGNLTMTSANGAYQLTEPNGENISIQHFQVVDAPGLSLDITAGVDVGDTVAFTLTGSQGESVDISYPVATANNNELLTAIQTDLAADADGSAFSVSQAAPGAPVELRYIGDTNGNATFQMTAFTDGVADDAQIAVAAVSNASVTNAATALATTRFVNGTDLAIIATDNAATASYTGTIGDAVTLLEGSGDSSVVAGRLSVTTQTGFELSSNVSSGFGGLLTESVDLNEITHNRFLATIDRVIANIDQSMENLLRTRSGIGARLNALDSTAALNEGISLELQSYLAELQDLDYAEAITTMQMQTMILEASQNSFVQIANLSLFNFL
jgi:flagellar hook-associated protein 3 FlgL